MHPTLNYRQSRRSACDRCRGFKLRCERDQVNGRSCERCLKAQVVCTTSIGHPASSFISSKSTGGGLPSGYDDRIFHGDRFSMPILHKSSSSKVRKSVVPSNIGRRCEIQDLGYWGRPEVFPYPNGGGFPAGESVGPKVPSHPALVFPYEQWGDASPWKVDPYYMQQPSLEETFLGTGYGFSELPPSHPGILHLGNLSLPENGPQVETIVPPPVDPVGFPEPGSSTMDEPWGTSWDADLDSRKNEAPPLAGSVNEPSADPNNLLKQLLKLDLEVVEDLELLEPGTMILGPPPLLQEDINAAVGRLDLPIYRMLNHSAEFLSLIQSGNVGSGDPFIFANFETGAKEHFIHDDRQRPITEAAESNIEDGATTASSNDSGYLTMIPSPSDQFKPLSSSNFDMSTSLSMLATYCHLVRVYRAIFAQLYQLFLVLPSTDTATFFLLPSLQFGHLNMDGNLTVQVQALIELSSSLLSKIELAMGMPYGSARELDGDRTPAGHILEDSPLSSIREHVMAQERMNTGVSLKETIDCLRQLVKDAASA